MGATFVPSASAIFGTPRDPLIVLDLANNHNGDVKHGLRTIDQIAEVTREFDLRVAVKFQYRDLPTFIHKDFVNRLDLKYIKRFVETRLSESDFAVLHNRVKQQGLLSACTPFDEVSVQRIENEGFDILKIASASFTDWPLLEVIACVNLPIIASTAGASLEEIDRVANFLSHRSKIFALMHCVARYPTPQPNLNLGKIALLKSRYEDVPIGYSTHEDPSDLISVQLALAMGGSIFERHVGVPTEGAGLNGYSSSPEVLRSWLSSITESIIRVGEGGGDRRDSTELGTLRDLRRGVYLKTDVEEGNEIKLSDVYFATPLQDAQISANEWSKYSEFLSLRPISKDSPLLSTDCRVTDNFENIMSIVRDAKKLFADAGVRLPAKADLEISHHYGLEKFREFGLLMVTVINREYCKKLLGLLPGQTHPEQWHEVKEETFHCLHGEMSLLIDGRLRQVGPGEVVTVSPGTRHKFVSDSGCVLEEISSTHASNDSFYTDATINGNRSRKTYVSFWT